jgi:hypothetical protein
MSKLRLAICIRGNVRSWNKCKNNIFKIFDYSDSFEVDWFFDTWHRDSWPNLIFSSDFKLVEKKQVIEPIDDVIISSIKKDFDNNNLNLISCTAHFDDTGDYGHFISQNKLMYLSNLSKRKHEIKIKKLYDVVLQIRPDCVYDENMGILVKDGLTTLAFTSGFINMPGGCKDTKDELNCDIFMRPTTSSPQLIAGGPSKLPLAYDLIFYGPNDEINMLSDCFLEIKDMKHFSNLIMGHTSTAWYIRRYGTFLKHSHTVHIVRRIKIDNFYSYEEMSEDFLTDFTNEKHDLLAKLNNVFYAG